VGHSGGIAYGRTVVNTGLSKGGGANDGAGAGGCCPSVYDSWTAGRSSRCETFGFYVGSRGCDNPVVENDSFSATQDLQWRKCRTGVQAKARTDSQTQGLSLIQTLESGATRQFPQVLHTAQY